MGCLSLPTNRFAASLPHATLTSACLAATAAALLRGLGEVDGGALRRPDVAEVGMQKVLLDVLAVDLGEDALEGGVDVGVVEGRSLDEEQLVLLSKRLGLLGGNGAQVLDIALVADQHNHDLGHRVLLELAEPTLHVLISLGLRDVVHQHRTHRTTVVRAGDGAVTLLASGVPDLRLDDAVVDGHRSRGKLHTDGALALHVELIAREPAQEVRLADAGVAS